MSRGFTCSFCGNDQRQVGRLIAGNAVYICSECVELAAEICVEDGYVRSQDRNGVSTSTFDDRPPFVLATRHLEARVSVLEAQVAALLQRKPRKRSV